MTADEQTKRAQLKAAFERFYVDKFVVDKLNQGVELKTRRKGKKKAKVLKKEDGLGG